MHALLVSHCGGALKASTSSQEIVLPNFPDYALNCTWIVTASEPSSHINITVNYPRDATRCHQDYSFYIHGGRFLNCYTKKYGYYFPGNMKVHAVSIPNEYHRYCNGTNFITA